jgi:hypothetical protein
MLCTDVNWELGTPPASTDSPRRWAIYDRLLREVAASYPSTVSVIDYGSILCPNGKFSEYLDGVQIRSPDGVHTPAFVPQNPYAENASVTVAVRFYGWIARRLWPKIIAANTVMTGVGATTVPTVGGPSSPSVATG